MLANRSSTIVAERGSGRMTYATKKPFAEHDLRVTLERAGNKKLSELKPARDAHGCHITNIEPLAPY